jgi:uncharacterized protein YjbJ (UPF0337 family)
MNKDILKGQWKEIKGQVKRKWGKLTDDDIDRIDGSYEELVGALQKEYGYSREEAEREVDNYQLSRTH